jgi:hypothetical protein
LEPAFSYNQAFAWTSAGATAPQIGADTEETATGSLDGYIYTGSAFDAVACMTGSYTGWGMICATHAAGDAFVKFSSRKDADGSLSVANTASLSFLVGLAEIHLGLAAFGDQDVDIAQLLLYSRVLDATEILAQSYAGRTILDDTGLVGNPDLSSAATADTDLSPAGNDFTTVGSLTDVASVPASW